MDSEPVCDSHCVSSGTHGLGVDRVHGKEERCDESQARVFENAAFTGVHEQAGYGEVQTHIDEVEIQRRHAAQQDVQPDVQEKNIQYCGMRQDLHLRSCISAFDLFMC